MVTLGSGLIFWGHPIHEIIYGALDVGWSKK